MKILLYGENFWKPKKSKSKRSKSSQSSLVNNSLVKSLEEEEVKKIKKRYSLKKNIVEAISEGKSGFSKFRKFDSG